MWLSPTFAFWSSASVDNLEFYREITRGLGVTEYLPKPLTRDKVARHFGAIVAGQGPGTDGVLGGRSVSITGVRGGVGASTIAVNLAWHFGVLLRRHTVLLDPDLHRGTASFMLNMPSGAGLRMALEAPERIDALLAERAAQPVADRLHVLSGEEKFGELPVHAPGAAEYLLEALQRRYGAIVVDVPFAPVPLYRDLLDRVHQRVLVLEPTLASVRDTLRLLSLPHGAKMRQRAVVVLNRVGLPGGLNRRQIEDALKMKVDVAIADLPRQLGQAATMGEPAVKSSAGFRNGIVELARQIGFVSMPDAVIASTGDTVKRRAWFSLGKKKSSGFRLRVSVGAAWFRPCRRARRPRPGERLRQPVPPPACHRTPLLNCAICALRGLTRRRSLHCHRNG